MEMELIDMAIADIKPDKTQPRKSFDEIDELAEDIKKQGLLHNIAVDEKGILIYGERRWKAFQKLRKETGDKKYDKIPVKLYKDITPLERLQLQLSENSQRKDIAPLEKAMSWKRFIEIYQQEKVGKLKTIVKLEKEGKTQVQIAKEVKLSESYLSEILTKIRKSDGTIDLRTFEENFSQKGYSQLSQIENKTIPTIRDTIKLLEVPKEVQKAIDKDLIKPAYIIECYKIEDKKERESFMKDLVRDFLDINEQHEAKIKIINDKLEKAKKETEEKEKKRKAQLEFLEKQRKQAKDEKELEKLSKQAEKVKGESKQEQEKLKELEKEKKEAESKRKEEIKKKTEEKEILSTSKKTRGVVQALNKKELIYAVKEALKKGQINADEINGFEDLPQEDQLESLKEILNKKEQAKKVGENRKMINELTEQNIDVIKRKIEKQDIVNKLTKEGDTLDSTIHRFREKIIGMNNFEINPHISINVFHILTKEQKQEISEAFNLYIKTAKDFINDLEKVKKEVDKNVSI